MFLMLFSIFFLIFTYNSASTKRPRLLYQVYLDDQIIGKIESKKELESYFEKEGKKIKKTLLEYTEDIEKQEDIVLINSLVDSKKSIEKILEYLKVEHPNVSSDVLNIIKSSTIENLKANLDKIALSSEEEEYKKKYIEDYSIFSHIDDFLIPNGVEIRKIYTYNNDYSSIEDIYNSIQKLKTTSIMAYRVSIKSEDKIKYVYTINKKIFEDALTKTISTFVGTDNFKLYINGEQVKIKKEGEYIDTIFINEDLTIKELKCSISEKIYTDSDELSQYFLFGDKENSSIYTVKLGDTVESVALANKVNVEEIIMSNPDITDKRNILSINRKIVINELNPKISVYVVKTLVEEQTHAYETIKTVDESMIAGYSNVTQKGVNGKDRLTFRIYSVNGQEVKAETISKEVLSEPINEKITVGGRYIQSVGSTDIWKWPTEPGWHISTYWGWRTHPIGGYREFHRALDISIGHGTRVYAANNGTIITSSYTRSYGNYIIIDHNNGWTSLYAHMSRKVGKVGQVVSKGDVIGYVGMTGSATGPHLHFETWYGGWWSGTTVNPLTLRYQ